MIGGAPWRPSEPRLDMPVVAICGVMDRTTLIEALKTYDAVLRENGATGLFIFGSRAVGTDRPDSDLDLFIDYNPAARVPNIFRLMQIEEAISEALGIPVTITTRNALHPLMKDNIERDAVQVL
jgi:predicted nucleotidyltransferase